MLPSAPLTGPLSTGRRIHSAGAACHPLGIPLTRFRRLARLGLLKGSGGSYDLDELRIQLAAAVELEERIAAMAGDRLDQAEQRGALAFLLAGARLTGATRPADLCQEVARILAVMAEGSIAGATALRRCGAAQC